MISLKKYHQFILLLIISTFIRCDKMPLQNGSIQVKERSVSDFNLIRILGNYNVYLIDTNYYNVSIEGPENLIPLIEIIDEGDSLIIQDQIKGDWYRKYEKINIYISYDSIKNVVMAKPCSLFSEDTLRGEFLMIWLTGVLNKVDLTLNVNRFYIKTSYKETAEIVLKGKSNYIDLWAYNACKIDAFNLLTQHAWIKSYSLEDIKINVLEILESEIYNKGNIIYKNKPKLIKLNNEGSGSVLKTD